MLKKQFLPIIILIILTVIGYNTFINEVERIKVSSKDNITVRYNLLHQYVRLLSVTNNNLSESFVDTYSRVKNGYYQNSQIFDSISYLKPLGLYGISDQNNSNMIKQLSGNLAVSAKADLDSVQLKNEITAITINDSELSLLSGELGLVERIYYRSAKGFTYSNPQVPLNSLQFYPQLNQNNFLEEIFPGVSEPSNSVVSSVYENSLTHELMLTISTAVQSDNKYLGALSLDINLDYISFLLNVGETVGVSFLLDENQQVIAAKDSIPLFESLPQFVDKATWFEVSDGWIYSAPVIKEQLYMHHYIKTSDVMIYTVKESIIMWLMLLLTSTLSFFLIYVLKVKATNKALMIHDPLTKLYNRHGFYTLLPPIYSELMRTTNSFALLMIDIDNFRALNDLYGYRIGDQVITAIAKKIVKTNRRSSICCRLSGGTFLVFCNGMTVEAADLLANRINDSIAKKKFTKKRIDITVCVGGHVGRAEDDLEAIIESAEKALLKAKVKGPHQVYLSK